MEEFIKYVVTGCISGATALLTSIVAIIQTIKKGNAKKNDTLYERLLTDIITAEEVYKSIEEKNVDCAFLKKQYVLNDLQIYANSKGVKFNYDLWEQELEHLIEFSKKVNSTSESEEVEIKEGKVIL